MLKLIFTMPLLLAVPALGEDAPKPAPAASGLDQAVIDGAVKKELAKIRACYNDNTGDVSPKPSGIVTTRFTIGGDGKVVSVEIVGSDLNNPKVETCLSSALKGVVFPAPGGSTAVRVDYPFRFVPSSGKTKRAKS